MNTSPTTTRPTRTVSNKENKMNTVLNARKALIVSLSILALLLATVVLYGSLTNRTASASAGEAQHATWEEHPVTPKPRVRFAALEGKRTPATLDGGRKPAALDGGRRPAALEGRKTPPAAIDGYRKPAALNGSLAQQPAPLSLIDGLVLAALAALLLAPARKARLFHR
jgi:hypothetical protein